LITNLNNNFKNLKGIPRVNFTYYVVLSRQGCYHLAFIDQRRNVKPIHSTHAITSFNDQGYACCFTTKNYSGGHSEKNCT